MIPDQFRDFYCIIDNFQDNTHGKISLIKNVDEAESIIKEFNSYILNIWIVFLILALLWIIGIQWWN